MGSSQSLELESKRVVIIGGGYGGVAAANKLLGKCQLTLIDSKEAFHHCLAALRACTEDGKRICKASEVGDKSQITFATTRLCFQRKQST